jgi:hypothetical protein
LAAQARSRLREIECACGCGRWFVTYRGIQRYFSGECRHKGRTLRFKARRQQYYQEHKDEKLGYSRNYYHVHKLEIKKLKQSWWRRRTCIDYTDNRVSIPRLKRVRLNWWKKRR